MKSIPSYCARLCRVSCRLMVCAALALWPPTARAEPNTPTQPIVFDLDAEQPTPSEQAEGRHNSLRLVRNDLTLEITRPGSVFDLVPNNVEKDGKVEWPKPESWGKVSLSTFAEYQSATPIFINFSKPVAAFSVWMGDFAQDEDFLELEAFSLPDGKGESLSRNTRLLPATGPDKFSFEELGVRGRGIQSVRVIAGSPEYAHSMFYDHLIISPLSTDTSG